MTDNVLVWRRIERNLFRKLKVYPMRYTPMSVSEQCNVEREMLEHFDLLPSPWSNLQRRTSVTPMGRVRPLPKKTTQALNISQAFFAIASAIDAPIDCEEMELAIRYKMGYGWLAWFLLRNFAVPIIKWLWVRYNYPTTGDGTAS